MDFDKIIKDYPENKDFIIDIAYDLLKEGKECYEMMVTNLKINDFNKIIMFAHKIKGIALYLHCDNLVI